MSTPEPGEGRKSWHERPLSLDVDLSAITANATAVKHLIGNQCTLMAVVKSDGYGLGASQVASAALRGGATWLGVARVDEGVVLRRAGFTCPILVMGYFPPEEALLAVQNDLALVVHRRRTADALELAAASLGKDEGSVAVHIKVDTGIGRFGCSLSEFIPLASYVQNCPHLHLQGLMTHFAAADSPDLSFAQIQIARFGEVRSQAAANGITFDYVHACNSAATLALPQARFDMARVGILLVGHYPAEHLRGAVSVIPAVTLRAQLARVLEIEPGDSVGYGRTWIAQRASKIGIVPVGYADGYPRVLSNRAEVLVRGKRCPVVGIISMDQTALNLTDLPEASEGDEVVLFGGQSGQELSADEVAGWAGTISYEILSGIMPRVPRRYFRDGVLIDSSSLLDHYPARAGE